MAGNSPLNRTPEQLIVEMCTASVCMATMTGEGRNFDYGPYKFWKAVKEEAIEALMTQFRNPKISVKKLHPNAVIPTPAHGYGEDAGADLVAVEEVILRAGVPTLVKTGISIELPPGYEAQVRPRSGLALKHGIQVVNSPGTIDPGYRGEICVILEWGAFNPNRYESLGEYGVVDGISETFSSRYMWPAYLVSPGDRIAQIVISKYEAPEWVESDELAESQRGKGGYGSSGK